ncbi:MAG: serine--tRNA ligase, partial [Leeuwenhoekiella sp.]
MLHVADIRENKEEYIKALTKRNFDASTVFEQILEADEKRRATQAQLDNTLAEGNKLSKEIGAMFKNGEAQKANILKERTIKLKEDAKILQETLSVTVSELENILYTIPNIPQQSVPAGKSEDDNEEVFKKGEIPVLDKNALPHWELAKKYDIIDFELGNKITGAGFPVYKGKGAR